MSSVLITGGNGFVGGNLVRAMRSQNLDFISFSRSELDLKDENLANRTRRLPLRHVVHAAGAIGPGLDNAAHEEDFFKRNFLTTLGALTIAKEHRVPMTYVSSYVYGNQEGAVSETTPPSPHNSYAASKLMGEHLCQQFNRLFGVDVVIIRPFNLYGPGQSAGQIVPDLIAQVLSKSSTVTVRNSATVRDYLYIEDLIELIVSTLDPLPGFTVMNAGSGVLTSVGELANEVLRLTGARKKLIEQNGGRGVEIRSGAADTRLAKKISNWEPRTPLADGLSLSIAAFQ